MACLKPLERQDLKVPHGSAAHRDRVNNSNSHRRLQVLASHLKINMASSQQAADLLESIDWSATECLNASSQRPLDNALKQVQ